MAYILVCVCVCVCVYVFVVNNQPLLDFQAYNLLQPCPPSQ
jgi:hypothetical protein